ncbi:sigma-70 family RNA polymerase sigma factor [Nannocystis sp. ILAH1]|uniref:RNA polymerase sigma factor n=1 Tax=Nannocystis sp. ILAH1 TaxID=2996789 RepID=UPI002271172F|nr:sigma-70 family RNA polymerase sigma factor [Nannocystis sp. ILAH1]MCY0987225.1 sigma-70 family RNA polymerase sigma factor [Nannocystis sp. ILAH1]
MLIRDGAPVVRVAMTPDALTDLELLARWRAGDHAMGSALYRRYAPAITSFFRRNARDRADVEELAQETFIALRRSNSAVENVSAYLFQIAKFKLIGYIRKFSGLPDLMDEAADLEQVGGEFVPEPEYIQAQREDTRLLLRAIRRLPLKHQLVIELSFWAEKTGPEIAEILAIPVGTVASRLRQAKACLVDKLRELADSHEALRATTTTVDQWRIRLRELLAQQSTDESSLDEASS